MTPDFTPPIWPPLVATLLILAPPLVAFAVLVGPTNPGASSLLAILAIGLEAAALLIALWAVRTDREREARP